MSIKNNICIREKVERKMLVHRNLGNSKCFITKMHSEATSLLANHHSLQWGGGQDSLMKWKDEIICTCMKMFIKEKELHLQQEMHDNLLIGCYMTSDGQIKRFDPTVTLFVPKRYKNVA